jgi:MFS family permease
MLDAFRKKHSFPSDRLWPVCICAGMFLYFLQITLLFPVLPLYITDRWPGAGVGFIVGAMAAGLLFFRPPIGWCIDRRGRKPVMMVGLGLMFVVAPLYVWSPNPFWFIVARVLHGISQAAFATASQTMLVDLTPPERRATWLGYLAMSNTIGFSLGPLSGSLLYDRAGFFPVVLLMVGLTLIGAIVSWPLPWKFSPMNRPESSRGKTSFPWRVLFGFPVREATLLFFLNSFLHGAIVTFLPLFVTNAALFFSLNALVAVPVRFALGRWGDRISKKWVVALGILCSGAAAIGLAIAPRYLLFWSLIYGLGFGSLFPVLSAIVSLAAPKAVRGRVYSVFLAGFDSGMTLGGAGVGILVGKWSIATVFILLGGVACGASPLAFDRFSRKLPAQR